MDAEYTSSKSPSPCVGVVALMLLAVTAIAPAADVGRRLERLLPADTLAFVSVGNLPRTIDRWQQQGLRWPMANPALRAVARRVEELLPPPLESQGLDWSELTSLPAGEACLAVVPTKTGRPAVVIAMQVGGRREKVEKYFAELGKSAGKLPEKAVDQTRGQVHIQRTGLMAFFVRDDILVAATDPAVALAMNQAWPGSGGLLADKTFRAAMQRCEEPPVNGEPDVRWFLRPIEYGAAQSCMSPASKPDPAIYLRSYLGAAKRTGFDAIRAFAGIYRIGHDLHALDYRVAVYAPDQKAIAMRVFQFPNSPAEELPSWVPQEAAGVTSFSWDIQASFEAFGKLVDRVMDTEGLFSQILDGFIHDPAGPQVDLRSEFIRRLKKRAIALTGSEKPGQVVADRTLVAFEVTDEPAFAQALAKSMAKESSDSDVKFQKRTIAGHTVYQFEKLDDEPEPAEKEKPAKAVESQPKRKRCVVLAVAHGFFFWGSDVALLERCLSPATPLAKDLRYVQVRQTLDRLAAGPTSFRSYARRGDDFRLLARCVDQDDFFTPFCWDFDGSDRAGSPREQQMAKAASAAQASPGPGGWFAKTLDDGWIISGVVLKPAR